MRISTNDFARFLRESAKSPLVALSLMAAACSSPAPTGNNSAGNATAAAAPGLPPLATGAQWGTNGAIACTRYLTPEFLGTIFPVTTGTSAPMMTQTCSFDGANGVGIRIRLNNTGGAESFRAMQPNLTNPQPVPGIGDGAVWSVSGLDSYKGERSCGVNVLGPPSSRKLDGQALAAQLGTICNALFAVP